MPLKWIAWATGLLALSAGLVMTAPIPTTSLPQAIHWRQDLFEIPFHIPPVQEPSDTPVGVRLYVSKDQGASWQLDNTVEPNRGKFIFRAPHDGEYWFMVRTVDRQNRMRPEGTMPELRVVVDTTPPRLELQAARGTSGEVTATWQMLDPNIRHDSLKIEYQTAPDQPWSAVALEPVANQGAFSHSGKVSWWSTGETVRVRADVSDQAGNSIRSETIVGRGAGNPIPSTAGGGEALPANNSFAQQPSVQTSANPAASVSTFPPLNQGNGNRSWPVDQKSDVPFNRSAQTANRPAVPTQEQMATISQNSTFSSTGGTRPSDGFQAQQISGYPPIANQFASGTSSGNSPPSIDDSLPPGERPRMVSGKSFEMEYEVESVGPSGIAKVELWGTRDGGRTWASYGVDPDSRSPMRIQVEGEGIYGFRISVQSGIGLGGAPPQNGDAPEVWVGVDLTKPIARLINAEAGAGDRAGELIIRWEASDAGLGQRPISLAFSPQPGGPWYTIAAGLENNGSYGWRLDNRVPDQVYLRLEVRDEAGNTALYDATEAVTLERIRPTGRIRNVRPADETATGPKQYRFF